MNEYKVRLKENDLTNLFVFLDRVEYKGLKEVEAIQMLTYALKNAEPNQEPQEEVEKEK